MAFEIHKTIRLGDTDAAGRIFVANYIRLAHEAYEEWLSIAGIELSDCISGKLPVFPIVHVEADFSRPVQIGHTLSIQVLAVQSGNRSFETQYTFLNEDQDVAAEVRMKHVAVDSSTGQSTDLPQSLLTIF